MTENNGASFSAARTSHNYLPSMHERWFRASQAKSDNGGGSIAPFLSISANLTGFYRSCHFHISRSFACFLSRNKPNGGTRMSSTTNRTDVKLLSTKSILSPVVCPVHFCMMSLRKADSYLEKGAFPRNETKIWTHATMKPWRQTVNMKKYSFCRRNGNDSNPK